MGTNQFSTATLGHDALARQRLRIGKAIAIAVKFAVTGGCLWYIARSLDFAEFGRHAAAIDTSWAALAIVAIAIQSPLVALRWGSIVNVLSSNGKAVLPRDIFAITAISLFFGQLLPYAAGDAMRVWLLGQLGPSWRVGVLSVILDRAVGVGTLTAFGFAIFLLPSTLSEVEGHRAAALEFFGGLLGGMVVSLLVTPYVTPFLPNISFISWIGKLALAAYEVLVRSPCKTRVLVLAAAIHTLTVLSVWCLGRALGLSLSLSDAAVLFTLMVAVALIPVSFGGWGMREVAVVGLLTSHGMTSEKALFFSVCFGLVLLVATVPGAVVWAVYSPAREMTN